MANTFKNAIVSGVGTSTSNVYIAPSGNTSICIELDIANTSADLITANVKIYDASADTSAFIIQSAPIPAGSSLQVISGQKIVLEAGDTLQVQSSTSSSMDAVAAILEDV